MKPLVAVGMAASALVSTAALADRGLGYGAPGHGSWARVVQVDPIVQHIVVDEPRRECWRDVEYRSARPGRVAAGTIAGGLIGGTIGQAIGNNLGDGRSRAALGLIGAAAGSAIANDRTRRVQAERHGEVAVPVERCEVRYQSVRQEVVRGYWVTYRQHGRLHRIRTHEHPGRRILIADRQPRRVRHYY